MRGNDNKPNKQAVTTSFEMSLHIANIPDAKILVISHERSGTHFLMNSIAANFQYVSIPWINMDYELGINFFAPVAVKTFFQLFEKHNVRNTFKSHHDASFYRPILDYVLEHFHVFYVYRDVYSTLVSFHRFLNGLSWNEGPKCESLTEFLHSTPSGAMNRYHQSFAANPVERWCNHVDGWLDVIGSDTSGRIMAVDYDHLDLRFIQAIGDVAQFLHKPKPATFFRPAKDTNVVSPSGTNMTHEDYRGMYSERDLEFVSSIASSTMERLHSLNTNNNESSFDSRIRHPTLNGST